MGQLRDWWPSEDALLQRSPALPANGAVPHSSPLQLLEAAAMLNDGEDPVARRASASQRTPIKLINSQDHKQELLRNLFGQRPADLHHPSQALSPASPAEDDSPPPPPPPPPQNPKAMGTFAHLLHQVQNIGSLSSAQPDDMALSLFGKGSPSPMHNPSDKSFKLERIGGGGAGVLEVHHHSTNNQDISAIEKTHNLGLAGKEPLTSEKAQNTQGSLCKKTMEKSSSLPSKANHSEKTHTLHKVEEHPINKELLSRREIHIYSERQRRKGMTHLYTTLLSLLPEANPKTDRCKVLTDAIEYIQTLREQMDVLGSQKTELISSMAEHEADHHNIDYASSADGEAANSSTITGISDEAKEEILSLADVAVRFCGQEAFITLNSCKSKGVWSGILQILHEQELEILNVTLSSGNEMDHHCIHARIPKTSNIQAQEVEKLLQDLIVNHPVAY